ncbi:PfaD family polyunsaturated fatty acid/polyketide biosynthesis protein [Streptomyces eurythermus]|uniref:PfaD family polyunsaturated fatty acid/polyketide biosynthesis protein n=1 Tax=Streptomyces eurythermus TaxID=42237 RepID=UPI0036D23D14
MRAVLNALDRPCYVTGPSHDIRLTHDRPTAARPLLAYAPPLPAARLGAPAFRAHHGVAAAYLAGAMAVGIASVDLVCALSRAGYLASFGAAGLTPDRLDDALAELRRRLGDGPYACNLIHSPAAPELERHCVDLCLRHGVRCVEASAFVQLTPDLLRYRLSGLRQDPDGTVVAAHRLIAKVSRPEVARLFLRPAPAAMVAELARAGHIDAEQAALADRVPVADDVTVEADSGGHTDRRPLMVILPLIAALRDDLALPGRPPVRIGAAGGLGTPFAIAAAFTAGADYVVTGSVNQACVEAGTSAEVKLLLAEAGPADVTMAPAADLFEQGGTVQVLTRGTRFAQHAAYLYRLYRDHHGLDTLPAHHVRRLEATVLGQPITEVWKETAAYLRARAPQELGRANGDPKHRMALLFRWYLATASRRAVRGETQHAAHWQIWCGPAMGAFNAWTAGTALSRPEHRHAATVATSLLHGAAFLTRVHNLRANGVILPPEATRCRPQPARPPLTRVPTPTVGATPGLFRPGPDQVVRVHGGSSSSYYRPEDTSRSGNVIL